MPLTDYERHIVDHARQLADLIGVDAICQHTGMDDTAMALASVFGEAQAVLTELATITLQLALKVNR